MTVKENQIKSNVPGEYSVIYTLTNKKDNSEKDQTLKFTIVDTTPPEIMANDPIKTPLGREFNILSVIIVNDIVDGTIDTKNVTVEGSVNINTEGTYPLTLTVSDKAGNKTSKKVNVVVEKQGDMNAFLEKIHGFWVISSTKFCCFFKKGENIMSIGYPNNTTGYGLLTAININSENTVATFNWEFRESIGRDANGLNILSDPVNRQVIVDIGAPNDNKILIDIGDGNGLREYEFFEAMDY